MKTIARKGDLRVEPIIIAVVVGTLLIIILPSVFPWIAEKINFFDFKFGGNEEVEVKEFVLRYDLINGEVKVYDRGSFLDFSGKKIELKEGSVTYEQVKNSFEDYVSDEFSVDHFSQSFRLAGPLVGTGSNVIIKFLRKAEDALSGVNWVGDNTRDYLYYRSIGEDIEWSVSKSAGSSSFRWFRTKDIPSDCKLNIQNVLGVDIEEKDISNLKLNNLDIICFKLENIKICQDSGKAVNSCISTSAGSLPSKDRMGNFLSNAQRNELSKFSVIYLIGGSIGLEHELNSIEYYVNEQNEIYKKVSSGEVTRVNLGGNNFYDRLIREAANRAAMWKSEQLSHTMSVSLLNEEFNGPIEPKYYCLEVVDGRYLILRSNNEKSKNEAC